MQLLTSNSNSITYHARGDHVLNESRQKHPSQNGFVAEKVPESGDISTVRVPVVLKLMRILIQVADYISPGIAGRIAYSLWITPPRHKTPLSEQDALASSDINYLETTTQRIATYSWGETGPYVLLVHGWSGRGTQLGAFVAPLIKAGYRVVSFDAPAHGKSSGKQTNLYEIADTIVAMQRNYGSFNAVITHSFGGPCVAVATQRGFMVERMVCICPPANTKTLIRKFANALSLSKKALDNLANKIESIYGKNIWQETSMECTAKDMSFSGLLIHDTHDREISWEDSQSISKNWKKSNFIKTSNLGHRRILRDEYVIESAVQFISIGRCPV